MKTVIYECGICDMHHPWDWDGDCRDDANRFNPEEYAQRMGISENELEIHSMDDRVAEDVPPKDQFTADLNEETIPTYVKAFDLDTANATSQHYLEKWRDAATQRKSLATSLKEVTDLLVGLSPGHADSVVVLKARAQLK